MISLRMAFHDATLRYARRQYSDLLIMMCSWLTDRQAHGDLTQNTSNVYILIASTPANRSSIYLRQTNFSVFRLLFAVSVTNLEGSHRDVWHSLTATFLYGINADYTRHNRHANYIFSNDFNIQYNSGISMASNNNNNNNNSNSNNDNNTS